MERSCATLRLCWGARSDGALQSYPNNNNNNKNNHNHKASLIIMIMIMAMVIWVPIHSSRHDVDVPRGAFNSPTLLIPNEIHRSASWDLNIYHSLCIKLQWNCTLFIRKNIIEWTTQRIDLSINGEFELVWNEYSINTTDLIVKRVWFMPLYFISWWSNDTLWDRECVSECPCVWSTSNELVQCWSAIESKLETMKFIHCTCMRVHGSMQAFYGLQW